MKTYTARPSGEMPDPRGLLPNDDAYRFAGSQWEYKSGGAWGFSASLNGMPFEEGLRYMVKTYTALPEHRRDLVQRPDSYRHHNGRWEYLNAVGDWRPSVTLEDESFEEGLGYMEPDEPKTYTAKMEHFKNMIVAPDQYRYRRGRWEIYQGLDRWQESTTLRGKSFEEGLEYMVSDEPPIMTFKAQAGTSLSQASEYAYIDNTWVHRSCPGAHWIKSADLANRKLVSGLSLMREVPGLVTDGKHVYRFTDGQWYSHMTDGRMWPKDIGDIPDTWRVWPDPKEATPYNHASARQQAEAKAMTLPRTHTYYSTPGSSDVYRYDGGWEFFSADGHWLPSVRNHDRAWQEMVAIKTPPLVLAQVMEDVKCGDIISVEDGKARLAVFKQFSLVRLYRMKGGGRLDYRWNSTVGRWEFREPGTDEWTMSKLHAHRNYGQGLAGGLERVV